MSQMPAWMRPRVLLGQPLIGLGQYREASSGAEASAIRYSIIETAEAAGIEPYS